MNLVPFSHIAGLPLPLVPWAEDSRKNNYCVQIKWKFLLFLIFSPFGGARAEILNFPAYLLTDSLAFYDNLMGFKIMLSRIVAAQYICCGCSVAQSCPTLCNAMDGSMPGFPVLHYLPEFAQIHVHWVSDAI